MRLNHFPGFNFFALILAILVSSCSGIPPTKGAFAHPLLPRTYHSQIEMSGRLSAQYETSFRPESISVHFNWVQTPEQTLITLSSPTGQTVATLLINARGAQLREGDKPPQIASNINQLSLNVLGWPLPADGLHDWLQGFLDAKHDTPITQAMANNMFTVDGWLLRFSSWQTEQHIERPKRLDLSHQTDQAGLVSIRIVVDEWVLP